MLSIKNLTKIFHGQKILDDISLNVKKGEVAILLGESGVGKSTILRLINNLNSIDEGLVTLDDKALDPKTIHKEHTVGMVFQNFNLFNHLTVLQNVTLALEKVVGVSPDEAKKIAQPLLEKYGLAKFENKFPGQLSGGQKQRVALVRSLVLKPKIICLDEPTSALDPMLTTAVGKIIEGLAKDGLIVLIATHDTMLLEKTPCTIYLMKNGKIIEHAQSANFFSNQSDYPSIKKFVAGTHE